MPPASTAASWKAWRDTSAASDFIAHPSGSPAHTMEVSSEIEYLMRGMRDPDDIVRLIVGMYASYDLKLTSSTRLVEPADTKCPMPFIFQKD